MNTTIKNIDLTRGDSFGFNFEVTDSDNVEVELDSCAFSCKEKIDDTEYVFQKTLDDGIERLEAGGYYVKIEPSDTANLATKSYYYDLEATIGEDVFTFLKGKLNIKWDVTKE